MPWEARYLVAERLVESSHSGHVPHETACQNRGWNVRNFGDRDRALAWLTQP